MHFVLPTGLGAVWEPLLLLEPMGLEGDDIAKDAINDNFNGLSERIGRRQKSSAWEKELILHLFRTRWSSL